MISSAVLNQRIRSGALAKVGFGLLLAGLFAWALRPAPSAVWLRGVEDAPFEEYTDSGEALIHGVELDHASVTFYMPLSGIGLALLFNHSSPAVYRVCRLVIAVVSISLVFALGCLLGTPLGAALATTFVGLSPDACHVLWNIPRSSNHFTIAFLVLVTAALLAWRARNPTLPRSLLVGLSIGATLLDRSTLAFFPPVLAIFEWVFWHRCSLRAYWKHLLALCVVPYLFLIPWIWMNWVLHHRFILFENGAWAPNIIRGALGSLLTSDDRWKWWELVPHSVDIERLESVFGWALSEIFRDPTRYLRGIFTRIGYIIKLNPVLFLLAPIGFWAHREKREVQTIGLLAFYSVAILCLMTVEESYFWPVWPLLAVLSAALADAVWSRPALPNRSALYRASAGLAVAALALVLPLCLYVAKAVASYAGHALARAPSSDEAWAGAAASSPRDAWLLHQRGKRRLIRGEIGGAIEDLSLAATLRPGHFDWDMHWAWARMLAGEPAPLLALKLPQYFLLRYPAYPESVFLLKAHGYYRLGRVREAREQLKIAMKIRDPNFSRAGKGTLPERTLPKGDVEKLRYASADLAARLNELLKPTPPAERLDLMRELIHLEPGYPSFWLERAALEIEAGRPAMARRSLARATSLEMEEFELRRAARLYTDIEDHREALAILGGLSGRTRESAGLLIDQAFLAAKIRDRGLALRLLARAEALRPGDGHWIRIADAYQELQESRRALSILEPIARRRPREPSLWLERADLLLRLGDRDRALKYLAGAEALRLGDDDKRRLARLYQRLQEPRRAMGILEDLSRRFPEEAGLWIERGEAAAKAGNRALALQCLFRAETLKPSDDGKRRLARLYESLQEPRRALAMLEALSPRLRREAGLWVEKAEAAARGGDREAALKYLARAQALRPGDDEKRRLVRLYGSLQEPGRALGILEDLSRRFPQEAGLWLQQAEAAAHRGRREAAIDCLARAEALKPGDDEKRRLVGLYRSFNEPGRALGILQDLSRRFPREIGLWIEQEEIAAAAGDRGSALQLLARAVEAKPEGDESHRIALAYQALDDHGQAVRILRELTGKYPNKAAYYKDKGLSEYLAGSAAQAVGDLERAIRLDSRMLSSYLTLAAIFTARESYEEALRVYDLALSVEPRPEETKLREAMLRSREELRSRSGQGQRPAR